jgi:hypothetical protein
LCLWTRKLRTSAHTGNTAASPGRTKPPRVAKVIPGGAARGVLHSSPDCILIAITIALPRQIIPLSPGPSCYDPGRRAFFFFADILRTSCARYIEYALCGLASKMPGASRRAPTRGLVGAARSRPPYTQWITILSPRPLGRGDSNRQICNRLIPFFR